MGYRFPGGALTRLGPRGRGFELAGGVRSSLLDGLLGYWALDGDTVDKVSGATAAATDITYAAGKVGQAVVFNGTTSALTTAVNGPTGAGAWSVSMWVNRGTVVDWQCFAAWGVLGAGTSVEIMSSSTNALLVYSGVTLYTGPTLGAVGSWVHLAVTYNGAVLSLSVNGGTASTFTTALNVSSGSIRLGQRLNGLKWQGNIDEAGVWNRALTAGEIAALYNAGAGKAYPW